MSSLRCTLIAIVAVLLALSMPERAAASAEGAATYQLRQAVTPRSDGSNLPLLGSLRQLRDKAFEPVLYQLAKSSDWKVQVHAVLGLAELSENGQVDPWLVTQLLPRAQEAVIANALDLDMLSIEQIRQLSESQEIAPLPRVLLYAELWLNDEPFEKAALQEAATSWNMNVAGLAACLLAEVGQSDEMDAYRQKLAALSESERSTQLLWLFEALRQYGMTQAVPFIIETLEQPSVDRKIVEAGLYALMEIDPQAALEQWNRFLGDEPSLAERIRFGLILLTGGEHVPASAYDPLAGDDTLLSTIVSIGRAMADGRDITTQLIELIDLDNFRTTEWALTKVTELDAAQQERVFAHLIERIGSGEAAPPEHVARAVDAAAALYNINPGRLVELLHAAPDDSTQQQSILLGMFDSQSPAVSDAVSYLRRQGSGRADSLALVLLAKHRSQLSAEEIDQLGMIASGGGRVSDVIRVQAAWLYLKHIKAIDTALAKVLAE